MTKEKIIQLLKSAAVNKGVAEYKFTDVQDESGNPLHLDRLLLDAADLLERCTCTDEAEDAFVIDKKHSQFLVDKQFTYLARVFTQGDIIKVVGYRKSDGYLVISINGESPIAGGNIRDLEDMFDHNFISKLS